MSVKRLSCYFDQNKRSIFEYTHAIVCGIPDSYVNALGTTAPIDIQKARKQHGRYVAALKEIGLDVIELPASEKHPDCVFVEDTAVVCNGRALLTKPALPSRQTEIYNMKSILENRLGLPVTEIEDRSATLEGGDVIFTGKEFLVGLSSRTNMGGVRAVAATFPEFPCTPIKISNTLHLKTMLTMAGPDVICVGTSPEAQGARKEIELSAKYSYGTLNVPDFHAANVVYANGFLLHRGPDEYPASAKVFEENMSHWTLRALNLSEMEKSVGSTTCCSILIRKTQNDKNRFYQTSRSL